MWAVPRACSLTAPASLWPAGTLRQSPVHVRVVTVGRFPRRLWGQACASPDLLLLFDPHSPIVTGLHLRWWIWVLILTLRRGNLMTKHRSPSPSLLPPV